MKQLYTFLLLSFSLSVVHAQEFQGTAVYESKTSTADVKSRFEGNKDITPEMRKMIEERMKQVFEKTFILNFDKTASIYKEEEKLEAPGQSAGGMRMISSMMGGGGTFYKNIKDKSYTVDKEFMGKEFLVKDSLPKLQWKMESETKQIGGYTCFKATAVRPVSKSDFRNFRPKNPDAKKNAPKSPPKIDAKEKTTSIMEDFEIPANITITAWYTPDIPVSQGPENYWGLPGLILEVNDGKTITLCSKIVLNPKDRTVIKAPTNGKEITQAAYDETVLKKIEELRQMNQGRTGNMPMRMGP